MPRRPRLVVPEVPLHIIQRGNNRNNCFFSHSDYQAYLGMLKESADAAECQVHAYVLMTNHVHLLVTPLHERSASELMKSTGERYVQFVNRRYGRAGTLWQGRYRSCLVQDEIYFMVCQRYIEMNPVRAGMVTNPALHKWSSHRAYAYGDANPVITPHSLIDGLGFNKTSRQIAYRSLFDQVIPSGTVEHLRQATNGNFAFGDDAFATCMREKVGRQVARINAGAPNVDS